MDKYAKLKELLCALSAGNEKAVPLLFQAEVVSIQQDCCTVEIGGLQLSDVRMKAVADGQTEGVYLAVPAVGSRVLAGSLTGDYRDLAILSIERFEKLVLGGEEFGGLAKVPELVKQLNTLEKEMNDLKTLVSGWVPVAQDGGAALQLALQTWLPRSLPETKQEDVENIKIVHG